MLRAWSKVFPLALLVIAFAGSPASAAPVPDLYVAQVPASALSGAGLDKAFTLALNDVLVKVTGQRTIAADETRRRSIGPAGPLVSQYQPVPGGQVRVTFDAGALRRRLDAANLPVWGDNRPVTLVILPADAPGEPVHRSAQVLSVAANRGLPVLLASEPAAGVATATNPLLDPQATARAAGADLLLIGRGSPVGGPAVLRWTLAQGQERAEWQGDASDGINGLADRLSARYASAATSGGALQVRIEGVDTFDAYGRVQAYLRGVGLIQSADLRRVTADGLDYELVVRGDLRQLNDVFALQRVLEPAAGSTVGDLRYRLVDRP